MRNLRVTAIPPGKPKDWYGRTRPCVHCDARVVYRNQTGDLVTITVQHRAKCPVVKGG